MVDRPEIALARVCAITCIPQQKSTLGPSPRFWSDFYLPEWRRQVISGLVPLGRQTLCNNIIACTFIIADDYKASNASAKPELRRGLFLNQCALSTSYTLGSNSPSSPLPPHYGFIYPRGSAKSTGCVLGSLTRVAIVIAQGREMVSNYTTK